MNTWQLRPWLLVLRHVVEYRSDSYSSFASTVSSLIPRFQTRAEPLSTCAWCFSFRPLDTDEGNRRIMHPLLDLLWTFSWYSYMEICSRSSSTCWTRRSTNKSCPHQGNDSFSELQLIELTWSFLSPSSLVTSVSTFSVARRIVERSPWNTRWWKIGRASESIHLGYHSWPCSYSEVVVATHHVPSVFPRLEKSPSRCLRMSCSKRPLVTLSHLNVDFFFLLRMLVFHLLQILFNPLSILIDLSETIVFLFQQHLVPS